MTASVQDAFPVVEPEPTGPPAPDVSGGSADAGSAATGPDASAFAKELAEVKARLERLPDDIDARFKSAKDKRFAKVDEIYEWVKAAGGDPKKIEDKIERQALVDRLEALEKPTSSSVSAPGRATDGDAESRTAKFLNDLKDESGVELTDEEVHLIWDGKRYTNWEDAFKDARKAAFKKAKGEKIGAGAVVSESGVGVTSATEDELARELRDIQEGRRGSAISPENKKRRAELKAQLASQRR